MSKKIGFLVAADPVSWKDYTDAFEDELKTKFHWNIGTGTGAKDVSIDYEPKDATGTTVVGAQGNSDTYASVADQFVTDSVDVIVTAGELAAEACKTATNDNPIPVVIASAGNLSKFAGTNVTGFTNGQDDDSKHQILDERLKRMLQNLPPKKAVAVVGNATVDPVQMAMNYALASLQNSLATKNIPVYWVSFASANDFQDVQGKLTPTDGTPTADVVLVCSDPLMRTYGTPFVQAAQAMGIRTMHEFAEWYKDHKGNLCFGPDFTQLFRNAAGYVDQIIGSAKSPAKLPIVPAKLADCKQTP